MQLTDIFTFTATFQESVSKFIVGHLDIDSRSVAVIDVWQLTVLRPCPSIVSSNFADVVDSGNLHTITPSGRTFDTQPIADINTNMTFQPDRFTHFDRCKVGGDV